MYVHRSNRAEALVDTLAEMVARPIGGPTARECVVVQGKGMERWVSMQLARRLGIWANPDFPFPRRLIERVLSAGLGPPNEAASCFEPQTLLWSIAEILPAHLQRAQFAPVRAYLAGEAYAAKRIQLAQRIADVFDQYVVYRPRMVLEWETRPSDDWQAILWRALVARHGSTHIAARAVAFLDAARREPLELDAFPARVSLFGLSTLPPLYVEILAALPAAVQLHLFVLSPSREYWGDIRSHRELLRKHAATGIDASDLDAVQAQVEGHPLLASLGRLGRDFQEELESAVDYEEVDRDLYADPGTASMLTALQSDMLALRHRGVDHTFPRLALHRDDTSISVHACHGPMREVEVLHDQLLARFDADDSLQPRDVVVMSPAIDTYAPFIDAVFGAAGEHQPRIPYRISDRAPRVTDEVIEALMAVLATLGGRLSATEVLDLLRIDAVRARFDIAAEDLDLLRTWVAQSGTRWGIDAAHRAAEEQPGCIENTWRFGLDRLLLGYAMSGHERVLYAGVLPYDDMEGTAAELLGRLVEFCEALFELWRDLQAARTLETWRDDLAFLLQRMIASRNHTAHQHQHVRHTLAELARQAATAGFTGMIELDTLRNLLDVAFDRDVPARGFLAGGVTFCALVPMRSIPFRVVCLLGMNDDAFPRSQRPLGFDVMARRPQRGDRAARDDDRYLFLEAVLSARERLLITYVGQSIRDNTEVPPSVVVSELLDTLEASFEVAPLTDAADARRATAVRARVVVRHPLQPFSPTYFAADPASPLFSYATRYCEGARALQQPRQAQPRFLTQPVPVDPAAPGSVDVDALVRFFDHPVRAFLQGRLQLYLGSDAAMIDDREPMVLDSLQRWQVGDRLLERAMQGDELDDAFASVRAAGTLPLGVPGRCTYDDLRPEVVAIARQARARMGAEVLAPLPVDGMIGATRVSGVLRDVWPGGQLRYQFSRLGGRQEIGLWLRHLVFNWVAPAGYPRDTFLVARASDGAVKTVRFRPVDGAAQLLAALLELYWLGQTTPLPLFPRTSRAYAEAIRRGKPETDARRAARACFDPRLFSEVPGEGEDAYVRQLFGAGDPLDTGFRLFDAAVAPLPTFSEVALQVFADLLAHREELS